MDLPSAFCKRTYEKISEKIFTVSEKVAETSMRQAVEEEKNKIMGAQILQFLAMEPGRSVDFHRALECHL